MKIFIRFVFHRLKNLRLLKNRPLIVQNSVARGMRFIVRYVGHARHKIFCFGFEATTDKVPPKTKTKMITLTNHSRQTKSKKM